MIATGITTAPRTQATLHHSILSLYNAGFSPIHIFAEPHSAGMVAPYIETHQAKRHRGAWGNFLWGIERLLSREPSAAYLAMFQDDIEISVAAAAYTIDQLADGNVEPEAILSLYTSSRHHQPQVGWYMIAKPTARYGALGYLIPRTTAERLIDSEKVPAEVANQTDIRLAKWCDANGVPQLFHSPSLIRHTGEVSTMGRIGINGSRQCLEFCEDASSLTPGNQLGSSE